jgi:hypothetical protein
MQRLQSADRAATAAMASPGSGFPAPTGFCVHASYSRLLATGPARPLIGALASAWLLFGMVGLLLLLSVRLESGS